MKAKLIFLTAALLGAASAAPLTITILHNNDVHAHTDPVKVGENMYGGYARTATLINKYKAEDPNPIVLSAGDPFQGTLYYNLYKGMSDGIMMNVMGYQAMSIGNHEFDDGPAALAKFAAKVKFPVLAANLDVSAEPLLRDVVKPYTILTVGGERVGVIGSTTPDIPTISSPGPNVKVLDTKTALTDNVKALQDQGINKIIFLSHLGYSLDKEIAAQVPGIDVIVGGHSHTLLGTFDNKDFPASEGEYPTVVDNAGQKTLIVQSWEWGKLLGRLKVNFDDAGNVQSWEGNPVPVSADIAEEPTLAKVAKTLSVPIAHLRQQVIGNAVSAINGSREDVRKRESTMANVLADAALMAAANAGAEIALVNGGGVRASIDQGPITFEEAITVQPFGNTLTVLTLTGAQIKAALEHGVATWDQGKGQFTHVSKGMSYTFDLSKPAGSRVTAVTFNGQALDDAKTYKVATNNFVANGGDGFAMFKDAPKLETGVLDVDILINYLKANPQLEVKPEGRIVIVNEPQKQ